MKIAIATLGTRGDVQPYLALAKGLRARGHDVTLAAPENFRSWVEGHGIQFHSSGVDTEALLRSDEVRDVLAGNWTRLFSTWRSVIIPMVQASLDATAAATRNADVIIFHPKAVGVPDVVELTGALAILAAPLPMMPTADFPLWVSHRQFPAGGDSPRWRRHDRRGA
jgi:sterol 3beta-glucosyltransferase